MNIVPTGLSGCVIIEPSVFADDRGYFFEAYNETKFKELVSPDINFVQDNQSSSSYGVIRGLHYQTGAFAQAKLVRAIKGTVLDVVVDLRSDSATFGKHISVELSEDNNKQLFVPRGFAHGFSVLSSTAVFLYKCDNFYSKEHERGIVYNDPYLAINWGVSTAEHILSEKDAVLPDFLNAGYF